MEQRKAEAADRLAKQKQDRILRNMAKRNKKSFFKRYKKELMGAGVVFVAVYAACVLVGLTQRDLTKLTVNDSQLIKQHNESVKGQEDNTFYTLKENEFFDVVAPEIDELYVLNFEIICRQKRGASEMYRVVTHVDFVEPPEVQEKTTGD